MEMIKVTEKGIEFTVDGGRTRSFISKEKLMGEKGAIGDKGIIKEDKKMYDNEILNLYYERMKEIYVNEHEQIIQDIKEQDVFTKLDNEYNNKLQKLLNKENKENKTYYKTNYLTEESEIKIEQQEDLFTENINNLKRKLEEVDVLLNIADTYENEMEILKNYNIINEDGTLNINQGGN